MATQSFGLETESLPPARIALVPRLVFTAAIVTSAFLLFLVQPMIAKRVLPFLGGSPAVWQTSLLVFQILLLFGYLYAHYGVRLLSERTRAVTHVGLIAVSLLFLPIGLFVDLPFSAVHRPEAWLIASLLLSVGLPFFLLSTNAPLIQHWFGQVDDERSSDPYFLYSASNVGSFAALIGYPFVVEPLLSLSTQETVWSVGYVLYAGLVIGAVALWWRSPATHAVTGEAESGPMPPLTWGRRLRWLVVAFVPSSLMLGVTTHVTTDIASVPLLWIIPLASYILSFVLCFHPRMIGVQFARRAVVPLLGLLGFCIFSELEAQLPFQAVHYVTFFAVAMVCHGELARDRPPVGQLTAFFAWLSLGGAFGGLFNALVAPAVFDYTWEYPVVLMLAAPIALPPSSPAAKSVVGRIGAVAVAVALVVFVAAQEQVAALLPSGVLTAARAAAEVVSGHTFVHMDPSLAFSVGVGLIVSVALVVLSRYHPVALLVLLAPLVFLSPVKIADRPAKASAGDEGRSKALLHQTRNFFGVSRVVHDPQRNANVFSHGTTLHGLQSREEDRRLAPSTYYSSIYEVLEARPDLYERPIAVLGLGVGTLACLGKAGQRIDFFEIDPVVEEIAKDVSLFTYMRDCPTTKRVILGDARLTLAEMPERSYGLVIADVYSSDAIPLHLVTREAVEVYAARVSQGGLLLFHISNRYLDLPKILARIAKAAGLTAVKKRFPRTPGDRLSMASVWVVMAPERGTLRPLVDERGWTYLDADDRAPWTDDYANLIEGLVFDLRTPE